MISDGVYSPDVADSLSLTFYDGEELYDKNALSIYIPDDY